MQHVIPTDNPRLSAYKLMGWLSANGRTYSTIFDDTDGSVTVDSPGCVSTRFELSSEPQAMFQVV